MTRTLIALLVFAMLAGATWSQDTDPQASANAQVSQKISSANQAIQKRDLKRAESLLIEARKLCREKLSTSHRLYADSCRALALVYSNQKRSPKVVEPLLVDAKTTYEKTIGKSHNAYFDVLRMLGEIRLAQKRMHDAEKLFREVVSLGQSPKHQSPTIGLTCSALGRLLLRKREAKEATKFLRQAKEICGRFAGEEHIQFAICCTDLGDAYDLAGRREQALREHQIAKDIREKKIGKKDPAYIQSLVRLGLIQKELFRLKDAIDSFTEANTLIAELFGDDNPEYAKGLLRLASVYRENNDFDAAIELQRKAHRVNASALGESHLQTLTSLSEVGSSLLRANRYLQGKDLFLKLTETLKETRGEQDPNYFASNSQLARAHRELSEFEQAEKYYRITIAGYQKLYGAESKKCVDAQQGLAQTYFKMNRFEEAITLHAQVAQSRIKTLGRNHSTVLDSILYVVDCHNKLGDHAKALELAIDCGKRFEQTTGRDPNFAGSLATIGRTYYLMGNYSEAIKAYQTALSVFQDVFGDQHITYAQTNRSLAVIYQDLGDAVNASKHYVESKKAYRALKQTETNGYANLLVDYANYFRLLTKDKSKAKEILQQAIEIYEQLNKSESTAYAMALNNLAIHFQDTGDSTNAEKYFRKSMDVGRKAIGENNMQYARNQVNLGSLMLEKGDLSQAESLIESGLKTAANAGGANHIEYALFCHHLARVHHLKGDFETAATLLDESIGIRKKHLERTATSLSARQERRYALNLLWSLDNYISVCRKRPTGAVDAYQRILEWKGASTVRQRRYRQLAAGKETAKAFAELQSVSAQLVAHYGRSTYDEDWIDQAMRLISKQEKLERTIASRSPSAHTVPTIRELQASIPKDFAMVDFFRYRDYKPDPDRPGRFDGGQRRYVAFVIHSDSPIQMIDLGSAETIDRVVKGWREPFVSAGPFINTSQPSRTHLQAARSLRELVWNPVQAALKDRQSVLLSLDGALHNIPFAALTDGPDNRYLIEDYRFVRVAVATVAARHASIWKVARRHPGTIVYLLLETWTTTLG